MEVVFPLDSSGPEDDGAVKAQMSRRENQSKLGPVGGGRSVSASFTCGFLGGVLPP